MNDDPRRRAVLDVTPTSALLPPNGRVPIEVTFCPREEKFHNFNLAFNVRKKVTKLSINVKGEGFKVRRERVGSRVCVRAKHGRARWEHAIQDCGSKSRSKNKRGGLAHQPRDPRTCALS